MTLEFIPAVVPLESSDQTAENAAQDIQIGIRAPLNNPQFIGTLTLNGVPVNELPVVLTSPNGTRFSLTVTNAGTLVVTAL